MKLFSYLQRTHGVSRREYAEMIKQKAVYCNDTLVESFQADIAPGSKLEVRSRGKVVLSEEVKELQRRKTIMVLFHKPKGYTVAKEDKHNKTIYELLPKSRQKDFYYIGRLDKDSHGLLLLTNSPALVDYYEKPENNIYKTYEVQIDKALKSNHILKAKKGVYADESGMPVRDDLKGKNTQVGVELLKAISMVYKPFQGKHFVIVQLNE